MINILLNGCNGKMGQEVTNAVLNHNDLNIVAGISRSGEQKNNYSVYKKISECNVDFDVLVDFSKPECLNDLLTFSKQKNKPILICTTGFSDDQKNLIEEYSETVPIFFCPNTSIGINILLEITKTLSSILGNQFDIEIVEKHHSHKIDAPSGTSLMMANAISDILPDCKYIYGRHGKTEKRSKNEIGIHSIRGGTYPGEHSIIFAGNDEVLEITHTALSKSIFAEGAIRAIRYMTDKKPGLYFMSDIIKS